LTFDAVVLKKPNEINACDAFIEILHKITRVEYKVESSPDERNRAHPDVDWILVSKDGRSHKIAVEHTLVESFEGQIPCGRQSYDVVEEINVQCQGKLPTDRYYFLTVPPSLIDSLKRQRKKQFVKEMSLWVSDIAKTLTEDQWSSRIYDGQKVTLICRGSDPEMNGNVHRIPAGPIEADKLNRLRFRRAIEDKLPKLMKYKLKEITTALLLEDISGVLDDTQARRKDLTDIQKDSIRRLVDYVIILPSHNQKMIVGNVWKEKRHWYSTIPRRRKFSLRR